MMWVKETLPPRARARWLLMTVRLSQSSLTGTERTEVAVGTRQRLVHVLGGAGRGAAQHGVGRVVAGRGRRPSAWTPWAPGCWCPWRARPPWRPVAAWRRRREPRLPSRGCLGGRAFAGAFSAALAGALSSLRGRGLRRRLRRGAEAAGAVRPAGGVGLEVRHPGGVDTRRDRTCTGRTSPRRATRSRRSRRRAGQGTDCLGTAARLASPLPGERAGVTSVVKASPPGQQMPTEGSPLGQGVTRATRQGDCA